MKKIEYPFREHALEGYFYLSRRKSYEIIR